MIKVILSLLIVLLSCQTPLTVSAQGTSDELPAPTSHEIKVGSHVLRQEGTASHCYDNGPYQYTKVWEVLNTDKAALYTKTIQWLRNMTGATISDVAEDETDMASLGATLHMSIPSKHLLEQFVTWRFVFSFKDNKLRLKADGFTYYSSYDNGMKSRQVPVLYGGFRTDQYHDAGEYRMDFHKLQPFTKNAMRGIYEEFDSRYLAIVRSMKSAVISGADDNW